MAHIALISTSFHPQVQILAKALIHQRHKVTLITSKDQDVPADFDGNVLRPFDKNSTWEALRLIPRLISQIPDIWHFVFTEPEDDPTPAHWILAQFARSIPHKIVVATFFSQLVGKKRWRLMPFLVNCDLITTGQRESLMYLKREYKVRPTTLLDIMPPLESSPYDLPATQDEDIHRMAVALGKFFFVPGSPTEMERNHHDLSFLQSKDFNYKLVFSSHRQHSSKNYICVGDLSPSQIMQLMSVSRGTLLAFHDFSLLELQKISHMSRLTKSPLIVRPQQNESLPGLCRPNKTGWVLEQGATSLHQIMLSNPDLNLSRAEIGNIRMDLMDNSLNELQRLYQKAYQNRWP